MVFEIYICELLSIIREKLLRSRFYTPLIYNLKVKIAAYIFNFFPK